MGAETDRARFVARALVVVAAVALVAIVIGPWFVDVSTFGFEDWDAQTSHRELVRQSILRYHEFPGWDPFACGGFPAWGYVEADTIVVSPLLPLYLVLPMSIALRVEVIAFALVGVAGAYAAASRFASSEAARGLVVALWALDGRWALQTAAGHTWHLAYAFLPWCLYFFERAREPSGTTRDVALGAAGFAMLIYTGGIYPLPHTVLALGLYAAFLAVAERLRPLVKLAAMGAAGVGLAAPKLLPLLDGFAKAPRLIESKESLDLGALVTMLTSHDQAFGSRPARVTPYGWHEWGIYVGVVGAVAMLLGVLFVRGRREAALKLTGLVFVVLGLGAFHPAAPWPWLHEHVPVFKSQHVPSRFLYPAVLLLALVAAAGVSRLLARAPAWADAAAALVVVAIAVDVGLVAQKPMAATMWMIPPDAITSGAFHFEKDPPLQYKKRHWAGPMYLAMLANTGVIACYGTPPFEPIGALPRGAPGYRGEAWLDGPGTARVVAWSPNHVDIDVDGANPGELLVYNMNFDHGWSVSTGALESHEGALATRVAAGTSRVTFRYAPPRIWTGLVLFFATAAALYFAYRGEREDAR